MAYIQIRAQPVSDIFLTTNHVGVPYNIVECKFADVHKIHQNIFTDVKLANKYDTFLPEDYGNHCCGVVDAPNSRTWDITRSNQIRLMSYPGSYIEGGGKPISN